MHRATFRVVGVRADETEQVLISGASAKQAELTFRDSSADIAFASVVILREGKAGYPSPKEIRDMTAEIRRHWSEHQQRSRTGRKPKRAESSPYARSRTVRFLDERKRLGND